jgi:hypothetical protein
MPDAQDEGFAYGALRFDPSSFVAASGTAGVHGIVITGTASHRQTARNLVDALSDLNQGGYFVAGTILQQAVFADKDGAYRTWWCGAYKSMMERTPACARNDDQGYVIVQPEGPPWLTTGLDLHGASGLADPEAFQIALSPTDLIGPLGFAVAVRKLANASIELEAVVNQGNQYETIWRKTLTFDAGGNAILPFWTHRLVLTRTGTGVAVTFPADGDGKGWP